MQTKLIQARHLHAGDSLVDGGDGVRRTAHKIQELKVTSTEVIALVRNGTGFDRRELEPKKTVRVLLP